MTKRTLAATLLVIFALASMAGCGTRFVVPKSREPRVILEDLKNIKQAVFDKHGQLVPGRGPIHAGEWIVADPGDPSKTGDGD